MLTICVNTLQILEYMIQNILLKIKAGYKFCANPNAESQNGKGRIKSRKNIGESNGKQE